jgi:hypothetical protein
MQIDRYVEEIRRQVEAAADAVGEEGRVAVERLGPSLDAAIRLALQDALTGAAEEITLELAPGSVEVRLRGRDPEFVVTPPPSDPSVPEEDTAQQERWSALTAAEGDDATISRINVRLPEHLKARIEEAAAAEVLSVNAWLVRAAAAALERTGPARGHERRTPHGAQRYTGWAR